MKRKKLETSRMTGIFAFLFVLLGAGAFTQTPDSGTDGRPQLQRVKYGIFVTDGKDGIIDEITKKDLEVTIDGKPVVDLNIGTSTAPLLSVLAVDNSGSMRFVFPDILDSAQWIINTGNSDDLTILMRFVSADNIQVAEKFTSDKAFLSRTLDSFYIEGGQTALIDAIYKGAELLGEQDEIDPVYRRTIVVISDGEDRDSIHTQKQLVALLIKKNVQVSFVCLRNLLDASPRKKASELVENVVNASSGFALYPGKVSELPDTAKYILPALRERRYLEFELPREGAKVEIILTKELSKKKYKLYTRELNN